MGRAFKFLLAFMAPAMLLLGISLGGAWTFLTLA